MGKMLQDALKHPMQPSGSCTCLCCRADKMNILIEALEFIRDGYDNHDVNHVDYRVKVYQVALDALAQVGVGSETERGK